MASTTSWPVASLATRLTRRGWCRTSRRCFTTTRCCAASTPICGGRPDRRSLGGSLCETADWMVRDLRTPEGGFASALDADTDGVEGLTYAWTPDSSSRCSAPTTAVGRPRCCESPRRAPSSTAPRRCSCGSTPTTRRVGSSCADRLLSARGARPQPARDDKVVAAWNGLAIAALAETGAAARPAGPRRCGGHGGGPAAASPCRRRATAAGVARWCGRRTGGCARGPRRRRRRAAGPARRHRGRAVAAGRGLPARCGPGALR